MAPPARLELTTLRLGGVRSIQVSYGGIFDIVLGKGESVNLKTAIKYLSNSNQIRCYFHLSAHIVSGVCLEGVRKMSQFENVGIDLDDLIYSESDGQPSDR